MIHYGMNKKVNRFLFLSAIIILVLVITWFTVRIGVSNKPDLIIESVTFEYSSARYQIRVKNIGSAPAYGPIYISNTYDDLDMNNNRYSYTTIIKYPDEPPLEPNESYIATDIWVSSKSGTIRFIVNGPAPDIHASKKGKYPPIPIIDESNFNNNTYTFSRD